MSRRGFGSRVRATRGAIAFLALFVTCLASGSTKGAETEDAAPPLRIVGSGYSMPVLLSPWADAFSKKTGIAVYVVPTGTSTGPPALIDGRADLASMTRPLREDEATAIEQRFGAPALSIPIARDEVAVYVNEANPIERMTIAEIDAVYSRDRLCGAPEDVRRWGQLGVRGPLAERAITLFGRRPGSGTATFFRTHALCGGPFKDWMRISPGQTSASLQVVQSRLGIGFGSLRDQRPGMKALAIAADASADYVRPGEDLDTASPYPLARTFDLVVPHRADGSHHPALFDFLTYVLTASSQAAAADVGYSPLTSAQRVEALSVVEDLRAGGTGGTGAARARGEGPDAGGSRAASP